MVAKRVTGGVVRNPEKMKQIKEAQKRVRQGRARNMVGHTVEHRKDNPLFRYLMGDNCELISCDLYIENLPSDALFNMSVDSAGGSNYVTEAIVVSNGVNSVLAEDRKIPFGKGDRVTAYLDYNCTVWYSFVYRLV
jgi:hypothetical protein